MEKKGVSQWAEGQCDVLGPCREVRKQLCEAAASWGGSRTWVTGCALP